MRFINYEAWYDEILIYSGASKKAMVDELLDFVEYRNDIDESGIDESEIKALDIEALSVIGIKVYINKY